MLATSGVRRHTIVRDAFLSGVVFLGACSSNTAPDATKTPELQVLGVTAVGSAPVTLRVDVTVINLGTRPTTLSGGTCGKVHVALYDTTANATSPAWQLPEVVCLPVLPPPLTLMPGDSTTYSATYPASGMDAGAPPPAGTYRVKATLSFPEVARMVDAGTVKVTP